MGVLLVFLVFWRRGRYMGSDQQGDNPLLWMVARIFSHEIVRVGDFTLSLLRLYLVFFRTFIYGFLYTWG